MFGADVGLRTVRRLHCGPENHHPDGSQAADIAALTSSCSGRHPTTHPTYAYQTDALQLYRHIRARIYAENR